jgi:hypothetical protein
MDLLESQHHVCSWWKIMLENRFPCTSHICKNQLAEMPPQELVGYTVWICRIATDGIEGLPIYINSINTKLDDLVVVLVRSA